MSRKKNTTYLGVKLFTEYREKPGQQHELNQEAKKIMQNKKTMMDTKKEKERNLVRRET